MSPTRPGGGGDDDDRGSDEDTAFAEAMRGARPLARGHERVTGEIAGVPARRSSSKRAPSVSPFVVEKTDDAIAGRAPDVAVKLLHELRSGAHPIDARVDLHGRGREAALGDLERFVAGARSRGVRVALVIHGRGRGSDAGGPVLRPAVWEWLAGPVADRCGVMAFTSARPHDGGAGATLVMLRRSGR